MLMLALPASACGGDDSSTPADPATPEAARSTDSGSEVVQAKQAVAESQESITEWTGPTDGPPVAEGKTIYNISCSPDTEGCQRPYKAAAEAAKGARAT